ncbi:MAG: hypothetical protein ABUL69_06545 [Peristeroidobacter soli]
MPVEFSFADSPQNQSLELTYHNKTTRAMCLLPEHWPNQAGKINQGSDRMFLLVAGQRFPVKEFNTGYCGQGCAVSVAPGAKLSANVSYADFDLPEGLRNAPKSLEFSPMAFACPNHQRPTE